MGTVKIFFFLLISGSMIFWAVKHPLPIILTTVIFVILLTGPLNTSKAQASRIILKYQDIFTKEEIPLFLENPSYYLYPLASVNFSWAFSRSSIIQIIISIIFLFQHRWIEGMIGMGLTFIGLWLSVKLDPAAYANNSGDRGKATAMHQLAYKCVSNQLKIN